MSSKERQYKFKAYLRPEDRAPLPACALVTGASRRIGAAIARDLAAHGVNIAVHYNRAAEPAQKLCEELRGHGVKAAALQADLNDETETRALLPATMKALGPVDLLVNNASVFEDDGPGAHDRRVWDTHFDVHVRAPSILADAFAAQKDLHDGLIVNIIDQRVWNFYPGFHSYTLSKAALHAATKTLAMELAPRIRVNAIGPGPTLPSSRQSDESFQKQWDAVLLKQGAFLQEFGDAIRFMWRARSMTGQMVALDGGQHLAWETPDATVPE